MVAVGSVVIRVRTSGVRSPTEAEGFSYPLRPAGCGVHPDSCTVGTGGSFPGAKVRLGRDTDHSPASSAEVKKEISYAPSPPSPQSVFHCV
jgi:hypothetical protein